MIARKGGWRWPATARLNAESAAEVWAASRKHTMYVLGIDRMQSSTHLAVAETGLPKRAGKHWQGLGR